MGQGDAGAQRRLEQGLDLGDVDLYVIRKRGNLDHFPTIKICLSRQTDRGHAAGMFASLIGASFEGFVVDNEMLGMAQRIIRGIEVTDETIGLHVIEEVVHGAGHFLGHDHTVGSMIKDYLYPDLGDRLSPDVWELAGSADMRERARWRTEEILGSHFPNYIDAATDAKLREQLPIRLPRERLTSYP